MIVVTWNINSIKVRIHAVLQYLVEYSPDVLVVQETKSTDENFGQCAQNHGILSVQRRGMKFNRIENGSFTKSNL